MSDTVQEDRVRRIAEGTGYTLQKSRLRGHAKPEDHGEYALVDPNTGNRVLGNISTLR